MKQLENALFNVEEFGTLIYPFDFEIKQIIMRLFYRLSFLLH